MTPQHQLDTYIIDVENEGFTIAHISTNVWRRCFT
jgi:hypothetical protein